MSKAEPRTPWNPSRKAIKRVANPLPAPEICPHCSADVKIASHEEIYGRDHGDWPWMYACTACDARVGMHPFTAIPLGTLADAALRKLRMQCKAPFESIYLTGQMSRSDAYAALAWRLGLPKEQCHFGWFDADMCHRAEREARSLYREAIAAKQQGLPAWFAAGNPVADVYNRSEDVPSIFEAEDFELDWRECMVPVEAFCLSATDRDAYLVQMFGDAREYADRYADVKQWMETAGGPDKALKTSPLLCFMVDGKVMLDDGWHRLGVAVFEYQSRHVRALCALGMPGVGKVA